MIKRRKGIQSVTLDVSEQTGDEEEGNNTIINEEIHPKTYMHPQSLQNPRIADV